MAVVAVAAVGGRLETITDTARGFAWNVRTRTRIRRGRYNIR
jgi:hypothetical protein